jgi:hypothetical protein
MARYVKDVPPTLRGSYPRTAKPEQQKTADRLRRKPGQWTVVDTKMTYAAAAGLAASIRHGRYLAWRPVGKFEARQNGLDVYARYVGD